MNYGFAVYNDLGELVLSDQNPAFSISELNTYTGTFFTNSPTFGPLYRFTFAPTDELLFFRLPSAGDLIYRSPTNLTGQNGWLSTEQNLQVFKCKRASAFLDSPSGYGMVVRDSGSNITFRADKNLAAINEGIELSFNTVSKPSTYQWYCITNPYAGIFSVSGSTLRYRGTGVYRDTSSTIRSVDTDHPDFPPFLVLTANSA